jgi:hypothetical protein
MEGCKRAFKEESLTSSLGKGKKKKKKRRKKEKKKKRKKEKKKANLASINKHKCDNILLFNNLRYFGTVMFTPTTS